MYHLCTVSLYLSINYIMLATVMTFMLHFAAGVYHPAKRSAEGWPWRIGADPCSPPLSAEGSTRAEHSRHWSKTCWGRLWGQWRGTVQHLCSCTPGQGKTSMSRVAFSLLQQYCVHCFHSSNNTIRRDTASSKCSSKSVKQWWKQN